MALLAERSAVEEYARDVVAPLAVALTGDPCSGDMRLSTTRLPRSGRSRTAS